MPESSTHTHPAPPPTRPDRLAAASPARPAGATTDLLLVPPRLGVDGEACTSCGALLASDQRYCLSCGERRAGTRVPFPEPAAAPAPAPPPRPPTRQPLPLAALAGIAAAGALGLGLLAGALIVKANDDDTPPQVVAATPTATAATPAPTQPPAAATAVPTAAATTFTSDWPDDQQGWTVQIQTLPKDSATPDQVATGKSDATAKGAPEVGALDSDTFPTLDGGNYVIYAGFLASKADADGKLGELKANFPDAKVIEVSNTVKPAEPKQQQASPEENQKNLRNAPPEVDSEGTPPPKDNKPPGGDAGDDVTEIG